MSLDPVRALIATQGLGCEVARPGELPAPLAGTGQVRPKTRRGSMPGLDGMDHALTQIDGQG
jgi:hypothetical protein